MKKVLLPLLLALPLSAYAGFDLEKFAISNTLKCAHPTVSADTAKVEVVNAAHQEGDKETARVKIYYKGMFKSDSMVVDYTIIHASVSFIHADVLEDGSSTKSCPYVGTDAWQVLK